MQISSWVKPWTQKTRIVFGNNFFDRLVNKHIVLMSSCAVLLVFCVCFVALVYRLRNGLIGVDN